MYRSFKNVVPVSYNQKSGSFQPIKDRSGAVTQWSEESIHAWQDDIRHNRACMEIISAKPSFGKQRHIVLFHNNVHQLIFALVDLD